MIQMLESVSQDTWKSRPPSENGIWGGNIGILYWGSIGITENKMETTIMGYIGDYISCMFQELISPPEHLAMRFQYYSLLLLENSTV